MNLSFDTDFDTFYRMGQNMNKGVQYFKDILFVETEIMKLDICHVIEIDIRLGK